MTDFSQTYAEREDGSMDRDLSFLKSPPWWREIPLLLRIWFWPWLVYFGAKD